MWSGAAGESDLSRAGVYAKAAQTRLVLQPTEQETGAASDVGYCLTRTEPVHERTIHQLHIAIEAFRHPLGIQCRIHAGVMLRVLPRRYFMQRAQFTSSCADLGFHFPRSA